MQKPIPGNATGVPLKLIALDPNGNTQDIGNVTSDVSGAFSKLWTPPVPGPYTIIAQFAGSNSYWASNAETSIGVSEAPQAPAALEAAPDNTPMFIASTAAIIIAIAIVGMLMLRKRPQSFKP